MGVIWLNHSSSIEQKKADMQFHLNTLCNNTTLLRIGPSDSKMFGIHKAHFAEEFINIFQYFISNYYVYNPNVFPSIIAHCP